MADFLLSNDWLSAIIAFILVLIPAILIHELGHFAAAKAVGITILEFGFGFPPRMLRLGIWRGVEYTLNWLPLGGFVRPLGEDTTRQLGEEAVNEDRKIALERGVSNPKSVGQVSPVRRIVFMAAGALANFVMAFVLLMVIGLAGIPQWNGARANVTYVDPDLAFAAAGLQAGDVIEQIDGATFTTSTEALELIGAADGDVTLTVRRADVEGALELVVPADAAASDTALFPLIVGVAPNSPAGLAGLRANDLVTGFNGTPIGSREDLLAITREHLDEAVTLTVLRDGETLAVTLTPRANPPEGQGAIGIEISTAAVAQDAGLVFAEGVPQQSMRSLSLGESVQYSIDRISGVVGEMAALPGRILQGAADPNELRVVSPLGLSQAGGVFLQESIAQDRPTIILEYIALISLALGITNLLPIPALDGGRILFVIVEILRGRPISPEREGTVHLIGLFILLSLMAVVLVNDIANPITNLLR